MDGEILKLATAVTGAEEEGGLLPLLCAAARQHWEERLRPGLSPQNCGAAFRCAAAFTAAADFIFGSGGGENVESFRAGEVSVKTRTADSSAAQARELRAAAERLMAPYASPADFIFKGVRG